MTKQTTESPEPKRRRTIDDQIRALEAKKERQQLLSTAREAMEAVRAEVRVQNWAAARASIAILERAIGEIEKANGHG